MSQEEINDLFSTTLDLIYAEINKQARTSEIESLMNYSEPFSFDDVFLFGDIDLE
jgi:hypothetical protein